jgi:hypothetical protein
MGWRKWLPNGSIQRQERKQESSGILPKYGFKLADGASLDGPDDPIFVKNIDVQQTIQTTRTSRGSEHNVRVAIELNSPSNKSCEICPLRRSVQS